VEEADGRDRADSVDHPRRLVQPGRAARGGAHRDLHCFPTRRSSDLGHVVLPLLREAFVTPGWVSDDAFLAGYGAAQAVPGPLFTFAAYLGTVVGPEPHGLLGAAVGLVGIFLPGILILLGTLPFWDALRRGERAQAAMHGVNAAVVGILGAALYDPVWTSSVKAPGDFAIALVGFVLLVAWRAPPLLVVITGALGGMALALP